MPGRPVYTHGSGVRTMTGSDATALLGALSWACHLDADPDGRKYLWAWARCQATRDSFAALCIGMGWKQPTAERGRRRAANAIAERLSTRAS